MKCELSRLRRLEMNGGLVEPVPSLEMIRLRLPPIRHGYADAQIDDYSGRKRHYYPWQPGVRLDLRARFSHPIGELIGTAGFGFWNAPFGEPTVGRPALPQATWFFYASEPTDLPLAPDAPGRHWFASTLDATTLPAIAMAPLAPLVLLLNQAPALRRRIWPAVQRRLGISFYHLDQDITRWHDYRLEWRPDGCSFQIDGQTILETAFTPRGPLGFVCWIDNQYMVVTAGGRFGWGTLTTSVEQWLEVSDLEMTQV